MDSDVVSLQDIRLLNSVFVAAMTEAAAAGVGIAPSVICQRVRPLFEKGERDFYVLKAAALEAGACGDGFICGQLKAP